MQELLQTLSSIGQINRILPKDKELLLLFHPHDLYKIENQINFNTLEDDVLLDVFVGMVQAEKDLDFCCGSTTPTWKIYHIISSRGLDPNLIFANWAYQYTNNEYTPLGFGNRHGASSVYELENHVKPNLDNILDTSKFTYFERKFVFTGRICPYCCCASKMVDSASIYKGVSYGMIHLCPECGAYVGCHKNTYVGFGRLANKELRIAKRKAHHYFDQLWSPRVYKRPLLYKWLSERLNLPKEFTHIGMADVNKCEEIIELCISRLKEENKDIIPFQTCSLDSIYT